MLTLSDRDDLFARPAAVELLVVEVVVAGDIAGDLFCFWLARTAAAGDAKIPTG